jgi:lysophospholipase L1-like esterase
MRLGLGLGLTLSKGGGALRVIPFNSKIGYIGDSIIAHGFTQVSASRLYFNANGFTTWLAVFAGSLLTMPVGAHQGVPGETMVQINARMGSMTGLAGGCPAVVVLEGGLNDILGSATAAAILASRASSIASLRAAGALVMNCLITKTFAPGALTGPQETIRQAVNTGIIAQAVTNKVVTLDIDTPITGSGQMDSDGVHPNVSGSYAIGRACGPTLAAYLIQGDPLSLLATGTVFVSNLALTGTGGTLVSTATGVVADTHLLTNASGQGSGIAGSKAADGKQVVTLSGTYTAIGGDGANNQLYNRTTTGLPSVGNVLEGIGAIQVLTALGNVTSLRIQGDISDAGFVHLGHGDGCNPVETENFPMTVADGRLIFRTPQFPVGAGTPVRYDNVMAVVQKVGSSVVLSGSAEIYEMGMRLAA